MSKIQKTTPGILVSAGNELDITVIRKSASKCLKRLESEYGLYFKNIAFLQDENLKSHEYKISGFTGAFSSEKVNCCYGKYEIYPDFMLAIDVANVTDKIFSEKKITKEPSFNVDAVWIEKEDEEKAKAAGYYVVSSRKIFQVHFYEILKKIKSDFISDSFVLQILNKLNKTNIQLARTVAASYTSEEIKTIFLQLIKDDLNLSNYEVIFQKMCDLRCLKDDYFYICNEIHAELGAETCKKYLENNVLTVTVIDDEKKLHSLMKMMGEKKNYAKLAEVAENITRQIDKSLEDFPNTQLIITCPEKFRYVLKPFFKGIGLQDFPILSFEEIATLQIKTDAKLNITSHLSFEI